MKTTLLLFFQIFLIGIVSFAQQKSNTTALTSKEIPSTTKNGEAQEEIKWYSFKEAVEMNKKSPKKIFIDVYTKWCGWCKVMDAQTFKDPLFIKYMNKYFYAVKLDAEMTDSVRFSNHLFVNPNPGVSRSVHELAAALLQNKMSYPTTVFLDEQYGILSPLPGFRSAQDMEPILVFFGENKYKTTTFDEFQKTFKSASVTQ